MNNKKELTGLEALERLGAEKLARGELIRNDNKVEPYINCIKQDLKRLKELEEKNARLHTEIEILQTELEENINIEKALTSGVWVKECWVKEGEKPIIKRTRGLNLSKCGEFWLLENKKHCLNVDSYGKTWALKRKELEDE